MKNIALFASGTGSNAVKIIEYANNQQKEVRFCCYSNKKDAGVLAKMEALEVPSRVFGRKEFYETEELVNYLKEQGTELIVLAGFLWLVPESLLKAFPNRIVNIHPSLLPKFGGKGMYGMHVHQAVIESKEQQSGITIHTIDNEYDRGKILFQASCPVLAEDSAESLAKKVQQLEHTHFPRVVFEYLESLPNL